MFYRKPPGSYGPGFGRLDATMNWTGPAPKPQPRPQPVMMNSGYPVLDLIAGLGQVFNRPMGTPPTFPPDNSSGGSWDSDLPDYGSDELQFPDRRLPQPSKPGEPHISKMPWPPKTYDVEGNLLPNPPLSSTRIEHGIVRPPRPREPEISLADAFVLPWQNDTEQQDWLKRWDIQPANDARYLPAFPDANDTSTGADIRRSWHNSYKSFASNTIGQHAPMFAEKMPQPQPQQSYGDFMGEIKNTASTLVNSAASQLGGGLGNALSFIPGLGPIMELIGQVANIGSTVAGATGLGGEKAGTILNLVGSIANGAAGGAATSGGTKEFGPPSPNDFGETNPSMQNTDVGIFSGLRPNPQSSSTAPGTPPFKPQPAPTASDGEDRLASPKSSDEGGWFKPLDQMIAEIEERQARGEIFDEKNNVWVKPATANPESSKPELRSKSQVASSNSTPIKSLGGIAPSTTEEADFQKHLKGMLHEEGGYSNNPNDPGGETDRGVSDRFYQEFLKRKGIDKTQWPSRVTDLSDKQRDLIYRSEFYFDRKYHKINDNDVRDIVFNNAVNAGPARAEGFSAEALKRIDPKIDLGGDNSIGPKHRAAIDKIKKEGKLDEYLNNYADIRAEYNKSLRQTLQNEFGKGWSKRNERSRPEPKKSTVDPNQKP